MKSVKRKVLEKDKDEEISSKGNKVIVDLIDNSYDEAKKEEAYYRGKKWVSSSDHDDERF